MINCPVCRDFPFHSDENHVVHSCKCGRLTRWASENWSFVYEDGKGLYLSNQETLWRYDPKNPDPDLRGKRRQDMIASSEVDGVVRRAVLLASIDEVMGV